MKNPDKLWKDICYRYAEQSKCLSRKVGCVAVFENHQIGQGWNGAPEGSNVKQCQRARCKNRESTKTVSDTLCCHAEINCLAYCARHGISTRGATIYCTTHPCIICSGAIIGAGIKEVVYEEEYSDNELSKIILKNAKIKVRKFNLKQ